jgi:hypothetical protein
VFQSLKLNLESTGVITLAQPSGFLPERRDVVGWTVFVTLVLPAIR